MLVLPLVLLGSVAAAPLQEPPAHTYVVTCSFTNPAYSGACGVDEEVASNLPPRAACGRVLSCLNDVRCVKTYCNATTVRRGWKLVSAARKGAPTPPPPSR